MAVYHGTTAPEDFNEFSVGEDTSTEDDEFYKSGSGADPRTFLGSHFAKEAKVASSFAKGLYGEREFESSGGRVLPVYLNISNPYVTSDSGMMDEMLSESYSSQSIEAAMGYDEDSFEQYESDPDYRAEINQKALELEQNEDEPVFELAREMANNYQMKLRDAGHDGIQYKNEVEGGTSYIAFEPTQIKSIFNKGTFDETNPDIRYAVSGTWEDTQPTQTDYLRRLFIDMRNDTKKVVDSIKKVIKVEEKNDPYQKAELMQSVVKAKIDDVRDYEFTPALEAMTKEKVSATDMHDYLLNRHAEEANNYIAQIQLDAWEKQNPETRSEEPPLQDGGSSILTKDAKAYLNSLSPERKATLERLAKPFDKIARETIETLVSEDMLSRKEADRILNKYQHYAPLLRPEMEKDGSGFGTGQGHSVVGTSLKSRKGSTKDVGNILANIIQQRESILNRIEKNKVAKAVLGLQKIAPNPDFWFKAKPDVVPRVAVESGELVNVIDPNYMRKDNVIMALVPETQTVIDPKTGEKVIDPKTGKPFKEKVIVQKGIEFSMDNERARRMVAGLKNLDLEDMNKVLGMSAVVTRFVASMNTQWNVLFGPVNFIRDFQFAMASMSATELKGKQKEVANLIIPSLIATYKASRNRQEALTSKDPNIMAYEDFRRHGGPTSYRDLFRTNKDRVNALEREMELLQEGKSSGKAITKKTLKATLNWISDYNGALENATRLAVFQVAVSNGYSKDKAASLAKNVTVNFNRKGQVSQQMGSLYAFFNASAQGLDIMAKTLNGPKGKKIIAGGIILGAVQAMALAAAGFDDEDEPPQFIRERSVIIPIGDSKFITVPMPLGLHVIPNIGRILTEWAMSGGKNTMDRAVDLISVFAEAFNPMGASGLSLQTIMPTPLDPFVALAENKDWTGKPIYRDNYNALAPTPGFTRTKDTASGWARGLSWAINKMSGGTENVPGKWSPTPDAIDYLAGQITGGVGREALKAEQAIEATFKGDELPSYKIPLVGRFYGNTQGQAQTASKFYGNLKKMNMHEAEVKDTRKTGKERAEYLKDNPEARYWRLSNKTESIIRKLNSRKRELRDRDASKDSIRNIDNLITPHMSRFNDTIKNATK